MPKARLFFKFRVQSLFYSMHRKLSSPLSFSSFILYDTSLGRSTETLSSVSLKATVFDELNALDNDIRVTNAIRLTKIHCI